MISHRVFGPRFLGIMLFLALSCQCFGKPFAVSNINNLRSDSVIIWADYLTEPPSQTLPLTEPFPTDIGGPTVTIPANGGDVPQLIDRSDAPLPGVYVVNGSQSSFQLNLSSAVQGFGAVMEPATVGSTRFVIEFFSPSYQFVYRTNVFSDGEPVYVGGIDPDSQLFLILIYAVDQTTQQRVPFFIGDLEFQFKPETLPLPELPIVSSETVEISPTDTYLHKGLGARYRTNTTLTATEDHENAHDLLDYFPALRAGDILLFERLGVSLYNDRLNNLLGVFMSTEELRPSDQFQRLPTAIAAGVGFYTSFVQGEDSTISTPTNIAQDFLIGDQSIVTVPPRARYVFFSKAIPVAEGGPLSVRISHIQRLAFLEWVAAMGLVGENAELDSDQDGDGLTLLEEFAYGHDPTRENREPQDFAFAPNGFLQGNALRIALGARTDAPVLYHAEFSNDMVQWDRVSDIGIAYRDESDSGRAIFAVDDPSPGPTRFGRIIIEYLPPISN
ncbi:hypothetical protein [Cerasicoccus frondis]|uniref:hypothetical protein n=1 Tax=Cerasicoccus frondis TaxID=490090 RepID=UPI0028529709|nr:hypothetical protein [Cerasicoccus frondis]